MSSSGGSRVAELFGAASMALLCGGLPLAVWIASDNLPATAAVLFAAVASAVIRARRRLLLRAVLEESLWNIAAEVHSGERMSRLRRQDLGWLSTAASGVNAVLDAVGLVAGRVFSLVDRVRGLPERISAAMGEIEGSSEAQEEAVEETASLMANINTSIADINGRVEKLSRAANESASSILEMASSIDEVARNAAALHETVDVSTSAVHEMGASIRQVADGSENVKRMAEETASSMVEMDHAVQQIGEHVQEASNLTERVAQHADQGSQAVAATIGDIEDIRARTADARQVLERLVTRIREIAEILDVIGAINDETNLLSLNAAIIAAQAGEQGKAFLVVANHVKTLSHRTASSTDQIERLIAAVQAESDNAVAAMSAGMQAIEKGVARSRMTGEALESIRSSARESNARVAEIARATEEQTRSSRLVAHAAQDTSNQVHQISVAIAEQSHASAQILESSEQALERCRQVHRSTDEQRETGRYISEAISSITDMIQSIQDNTAAHARSSQLVSDTVLRLLDNARSSGRQIPEVNKMVRDLRTHSEAILEEIARFAHEPADG